MAKSLLVLAAFLGVGCDALSECGSGSCDAGITITILAEDGQSFPPGAYGLEIEADGVRTGYSCVVDKSFEKLIECRNEDSPTTVESIAPARGLRIKVPAASRLTVTFRAYCPTTVLVSETTAPKYSCDECRQSSATLTATLRVSTSSALLICPDAGTE